MINNYAKNNLLPPPVKKEVKDHMLMLVFIYFKNLLSFSDIEELFRPITSKAFLRPDIPAVPGRYLQRSIYFGKRAR